MTYVFGPSSQNGARDVKKSKSRSRSGFAGIKTGGGLAEKTGMKAQSLDVAMKVAEAQQEREMESKISAKMRSSMRDQGGEGFRTTILSSVASENYAKALEELKKYEDAHAAYPQFKVRAERYLSYANDLVNAVRAKRSFPGMHHLGMSKQQDLYDRAMAHFEDLKATLRKIEQIDKEVRLDDVRSTVWVVKALIYSVFAMLILGFLLELSRGILPTANIVADDVFGTLTNAVFDKLGL